MPEDPTVNGGDVCNKLFSIGEDGVCIDGMASFCTSFGRNPTM